MLNVLPNHPLITQNNYQLLAHTLRSLQDAVTIANHQDVIVYVNPAFTRMYGYTPDEVVGQPTSLLWAQKTQMADTEEILPHTITQEKGWQGELYNRRKDGTEFPIHLSTSVVSDADGKIIALVGVARDITERKAQERLLKEHAVQIAQQNAAIASNNHRILTDLAYSYRIQQALLPNWSQLEYIFPQSFALVMPQRETMGSFYWYQKDVHNHRHTLALVEVGGQSMVAAMLSVLLYGLLHRIVSDEPTLLPDAVISRLESQVHALMIENDDDNLLLDATANLQMSFFSLSRDMRSLRFAGTQMNFLVWRDGRFAPIDPDANAQINYTQNYIEYNKQMVVHQLGMRAGDMLFVYNQGLLRCLGEGESQQDGERKLMKMLAGLNSKPLVEQKEQLALQLRIRTSQKPQVADMLLLGILL